MASASTERVMAAAARHGLSLEVATFPDGTRTAADAATAIGCDVAAIVKSLVFLVGTTETAVRPVVALVPGDRGLDTRRLAEVAGGSEVERAPIERVREATGFVAGGTPPFGHVEDLDVYADVGLRRHDPVWAAAGTPQTVFPISIADLDRIVRPVWADLGVPPASA